MLSFDFIIDKIRFSYSAVSSFTTCPYGYKLNYIDKKPRENNFFGQYGLLVHSCMEQFFMGNLEFYELSQYYQDNYDKSVNAPLPGFLSYLDYRYKMQGLQFFDNFSFKKDNYEMLAIEDKIDFKVKDIEITARPDLVLKNKNTGKIIQYDYKTSAPWRKNKKTGKEIADNKKLKGYSRQMNIYTYALRNHKSIPVDETILWFPRLDRQHHIPWILEEEREAIDWMLDIIKRIKNEEEFKADTSSKFFCDNLCGVRNSCKYR